jgi:hypothetical protein
LTTINPANAHDPSDEPGTREAEVAGGRSPTKQGPGQMDEDDTQRKRGGGDVERDISEEQDDRDDTRRGGHSQTETDEKETGGRSRKGPGASRNM